MAPNHSGVFFESGFRIAALRAARCNRIIEMLPVGTNDEGGHQFQKTVVY